eukprot:8318142-Pyramimonas_sp.AAC.1
MLGAPADRRRKRKEQGERQGQQVEREGSKGAGRRMRRWREGARGRAGWIGNGCHRDRCRERDRLFRVCPFRPGQRGCSDGVP